MYTCVVIAFAKLWYPNNAKYQHFQGISKPEFIALLLICNMVGFSLDITCTNKE